MKNKSLEIKNLTWYIGNVVTKDGLEIRTVKVWPLFVQGKVEGGYYTYGAKLGVFKTAEFICLADEGNIDAGMQVFRDSGSLYCHTVADEYFRKEKNKTRLKMKKVRYYLDKVFIMGVTSYVLYTMMKVVYNMINS
jgi:hypothetical protein